MINEFVDKILVHDGKQYNYEITQEVKIYLNFIGKFELPQEEPKELTQEELEAKMGFPIRIIQVDNGYEIVNDDDRTDKESAFEKAAKALNIELRRTRPYSPWQNGKVERSHREDGKILYWRKIFTSERELIRKVAKHEARYNKTAKTSLNFKNPNQLVSEYFSKCNICLDR